MSWFSDLAGRAESLLNNLDEQTGAALRNHTSVKQKQREVFTPDLACQRKRIVPRNIKKNILISETKSNYAPTVKSSPIKGHQPRASIEQSQENVKSVSEKPRKKSPHRKPARYNLNNSPKTLVNDFDDDPVDRFGLRQRRNSLPSDLEILNNEKFTYNMQNLEVENAMLKNELNVMHREVSELLDRLRKAEDELRSTQIKLECSEKVNHRLNEDKESLSTLLEHMKSQVSEASSVQISKYREQTQELESSVNLLKDEKKELDDLITKLKEEAIVKDLAQNKLENELRHAQTTIDDQQNTIDKTNAECHRIEKDWEAYKLRVKSMLYAKDNEIKSLREGVYLSEDTKMLVEQLETLKEEKEDLSEAINRVRNECGDMKQHMSQLETRHTTAERVVTALRDALKEERAARNRAEAQGLALGKELQAFQVETGQTIASLRSALQDKEEQLNHLRDTGSTAPTSDGSALNVADYDVIKDIDNEKIHYLTQMLIQKQGKIDTLLADNNILRIQLDKLESKHKAEVAALRAKYSHSVVHLQEGDRVRSRNTFSSSPLYALSLRIGVMIKRFPIFRLLIMCYMVGLHFWVLTVLFTSTPEDYVPRATKL